MNIWIWPLQNYYAGFCDEKSFISIRFLWGKAATRERGGEVNYADKAKNLLGFPDDFYTPGMDVPTFNRYQNIKRALEEAHSLGVKQGREEQREEIKKKIWPFPESNINKCVDGRELWEILSAKG